MILSYQVTHSSREWISNWTREYQLVVVRENVQLTRTHTDTNETRAKVWNFASPYLDTAAT